MFRRVGMKSRMRFFTLIVAIVVVLALCGGLTAFAAETTMPASSVPSSGGGGGGNGGGTIPSGGGGQGIATVPSGSVGGGNGAGTIPSGTGTDGGSTSGSSGGGSVGMAVGGSGGGGVPGGSGSGIAVGGSSGGGTGSGGGGGFSGFGPISATSPVGGAAGSPIPEEDTEPDSDREAMASSEYGEGMKQAIQKAKTLFNIPDDLRFDGTVNSDDFGTVYTLSWTSKDRAEGSVSVDIDGDLNVRNYYKSVNTVYYEQTRVKMQNRDIEKMKNAAVEFIKKVRPDEWQSYTLYEPKDRQSGFSGRDGYYTYYRTLNRIRNYEDMATITVNQDTFEVSSFYISGIRATSEYKDTAVITEEEAAAAYLKTIGYQLIYRTKYENDGTISAYPVYEPNAASSAYVIDAATGEKIERWGGIGMQAGGSGGGFGSAVPRAESMMDGGYLPQLTPEELLAAEEAAGLLSLADADQIARAYTYLGLTGQYELSRSNLRQNWQEPGGQIWELEFMKKKEDAAAGTGVAVNAAAVEESVIMEVTRADVEKAADEKEIMAIEEPTADIVSFDSRLSSYMIRTVDISVQIDAKKGIILGFSLEQPLYQGKIDAELKTLDEAKAEAVKVIRAINPDIADDLKYVEQLNADPRPLYLSLYGDVPNAYWTLNYVRTVNGIEYPDNAVRINYDAVNGKVINFNTTWNEIQFPAIDTALPLEKVHEIVMEQVGLELQYVAINELKAEFKKQSDILYFNPIHFQIAKVYELNARDINPVRIDAFSGKLLDYSGNDHWVSAQFSGYNDIEGHRLEQVIESLAAANIRLPGNDLKPDLFITQKDFLYLVSKLNLSLSYQNYPVSREDTEWFYRQLERYAIVPGESIAANGRVTREQAARYVIKTLDYDEIARLDLIHNLNFADKDKIAEECRAYVELAAALSVLPNGEGDFGPDEYITRAETFELIYNYMIH